MSKWWLWVVVLLVANRVIATEQILNGEEIMQQRCMGCHLQVDEDGTRWSRIERMRKSPEGWMMSIARMETQRGIVLTAGERRTLVKYLADRQGLAPVETVGARFILERQLNRVEQHASPLFGEMCARCHSGARVGLQRRSRDEWRKLVGFHLGQFPTIEVHAMARDRDWLGIATNQIVPYLAQRYPLQSADWNQWQRLDKRSYGGDWLLTGSMPDKGHYYANVTVTEVAQDHYSLSLNGRYEDGSLLQGEGSAVVYTGYEWRAALTLDGVELRQVLAGSAAADTLEGRVYQAGQEDLGGRVRAIRQSSAPRILAAIPAYVKTGQQAQLKIIGTGLTGELELGPGVSVIETPVITGNQMSVVVKAASDAVAGARPVQMGGILSEQMIAIYNTVDALQVTPANAIARVGGAGGSIPRVKAAFEAVGIDAGADGRLDTADDIRIGTLPAVWSVTAFDEVAEHDQDVKFSGRMDSRTGIFTPAAAGMNPARKYQTNNAGNLKVVAEVSDGATSVIGEAHLIVTVQRFNNPPIR